MQRTAERLSFAAEVADMCRLAVPLVLVQLAGIGFNVIEITLAGHYSPRVMGVVSVGTNLWHFAVMGMIGVMLSLSPNVAQLDGAGRRREAAGVFRQALWLGLIVGVVAFAGLQVAGPLVAHGVGLDPELAADAVTFMRAASFGAPALACYVACRGLAEGLSIARPSLVFGLLGLVVLAPLGWLMLYGLELGAPGLGASMAVTNWVQFLAFLAFILASERFRGLDWAAGRRGPDWGVIGGLFRLGGPLAVSVLMESGLFNATALAIGRFGEVAVAGSQIAQSVASVTFMVPLGFAIAMSVKVGNAVGRGDFAAVRRAAMIGFGLAMLSQVAAAALMLTVPRGISGLYSTDPDVIAFGAGLLFLTALFQLSDGAQVTAAAALRGLKDARVPMVMTTIAYWGVGMPVALWLTFTMGWRAPGMWVGVIVALSLAATLLWWRFARLSRRLMQG